MQKISHRQYNIISAFRDLEITNDRHPRLTSGGNVKAVVETEASVETQRIVQTKCAKKPFTSGGNVEAVETKAFVETKTIVIHTRTHRPKFEPV